MIENRLVGIKSREVYEVPAAALLLAAYGGVEELVLERDLAHTKQQLALQYATLVYNGLWFSPLRAALQAFMEQTQRRRSPATARVKLYRGGCAGGRPHGRRRRCTTTALATYEEGDELPARRGRRLHPRLVAADQDLGGRRRRGRYSRGVTEPLWAGRLAGGLTPPSSTSRRRSRSTGGCCPTTCGRAPVHVRMLARQGLIDPAEAERIVAALGGVEVEPDATDEDVHSRDRAAAGRPRPARARRPQPQRPGADGDAAVGEGCLRRADRGGARPGDGAARPRRDATATRVLPGYTHGQRAQPVLAGPAPGRARLGAEPRRPAAGGGARGGRRLPAGRGGAGRIEPAARSRLGGRRAGLRPPLRELRWTPSPTATT